MYIYTYIKLKTYLHIYIYTYIQYQVFGVRKRRTFFGDKSLVDKTSITCCNVVTRLFDMGKGRCKAAQSKLKTMQYLQLFEGLMVFVFSIARKDGNGADVSTMSPT